MYLHVFRLQVAPLPSSFALPRNAHYFRIAAIPGIPLAQTYLEFTSEQERLKWDPNWRIIYMDPQVWDIVTNNSGITRYFNDLPNRHSNGIIVGTTTAYERPTLVINGIVYRSTPYPHCLTMCMTDKNFSHVTSMCSIRNQYYPNQDLPPGVGVWSMRLAGDLYPSTAAQPSLLYGAPRSSSYSQVAQSRQPREPSTRSVVIPKRRQRDEDCDDQEGSVTTYMPSNGDRDISRVVSQHMQPIRNEISTMASTINTLALTLGRVLERLGEGAARDPDSTRHTPHEGTRAPIGR